MLQTTCKCLLSVLLVLINRPVLLHPVPPLIYQPAGSRLAARRQHHIFSPSHCQGAVMYRGSFLEKTEVRGEKVMVHIEEILLAAE